jgi:hypothetical protein
MGEPKFINMKKIMFSVLFAVATLAFVNTSRAQVRVGVNINIGVQPEWGPSGYDYAEYYYLPDIEAYYYVPRHEFVYLSGNRWVFAASLPPRYSGYDLYSGYKVVVNSPYAYRHFNDDRVRYARYRNYDNRQEIIRNHHDNGNHYGQYKNRGNGKGHGKGRH